MRWKAEGWLETTEGAPTMPHPDIDPLILGPIRCRRNR
ncbi:hypothetical protein [Azospirillum endophyticum]